MAGEGLLLVMGELARRSGAKNRNGGSKISSKPVLNMFAASLEFSPGLVM